jgi:hypothetical protein
MTDGCLYKNRVTGLVVKVLRNAMNPLKQVLGQNENFRILPKFYDFSVEENVRFSRVIPVPQPQISNGSKVSHFDVRTYADFRSALEKSRDQGSKIMVVAIGNLDGCVPCQNVKAAIDQSSVSKRRDFVAVDFNHYQNNGSDLMAYFQTKIASQYQLNSQFPYPQIYILALHSEDNWWHYYRKLNGQSLGGSGVVSTIEAVITESESAR